MFEAPQMAVRRMLLPGSIVASSGQPLHRWPGPAANFPTFWNPHVRTNAFLKSFGWPSDRPYTGFPRADSRVFHYMKFQQAVTNTTLSLGGSPTRAVPAVFVPTSAANQYGGRSTF